jgi:tetratricopeptide (TPR) repeat protein
MVQIGSQRNRDDGSAGNQHFVELSGDVSTKPKKECRYIDSFAVSSQPKYGQLQTILEEEDENTDTKNNKTGRGTTSSKNYVASALVDSGVGHHSRGEYGKALNDFAEALNTQRISLGGEHICIAHTLGNMGSVYLKQGRLIMASEALEEALRMKLRLRRKQNKKEKKRCTILVADLLNNLGNVAYLRNDYSTSLKYYRATLEDLRTHNGPEEELAKTLHNIGRLNVHQQEWDVALSVLTECHRMECDLYGADSILIGDTLNLLGFAHAQSSSADLALQSYSVVLSISLAAYGTDHPSIASSLLNIGMALEAKGQLEAAWKSYDKARDIYKRVGADHTHRGLKAARRSIAYIEHVLAERIDGDPSRFSFVPIAEQRDVGECREASNTLEEKQEREETLRLT